MPRPQPQSQWAAEGLLVLPQPDTSFWMRYVGTIVPFASSRSS